MYTEFYNWPKKQGQNSKFGLNMIKPLLSRLYRICGINFELMASLFTYMVNFEPDTLWEEMNKIFFNLNFFF